MLCKNRISLFLLLLSALTYPAMAQYPNFYVNDTSPVRGLMPYADQISSPIDNIDPVSGKISLSVPLASLPAGRGGLGFDVALTYDSHLYDLYPGWLTSNDWPTRKWIFNALGGSQTGGGWNYNFKNLRVWLETRPDPDPNQPGCTKDEVMAFRLRVGLPDGSAHILHLRPASGNNDGNYSHDGFAGIKPDGTVQWNCEDYYGWSPRTGKLTYYTSDGSFLKLEIDADGTSWYGKNWYLYFPDGRRVVGKGDEAKEIYDANGNKISIQNITSQSGYSCSTLHPCTKLVDDTGRAIMVEYNVETAGTNMTRDRITAPGPNGNLVWTVDWQTIMPGWNGSSFVKTYEIADVEPNLWPPTTNPFDASLRVVRFVQMPLAEHVSLADIALYFADNPNNPGLEPPTHNSYKFAYNDSIDIGAGELDYIRTPSGSEYYYKYQFQGFASGILSGSYANYNGVVQRKIAFNDEDGTGNNACDPVNPPNPNNPCNVDNVDSLTWSYVYDGACAGYWTGTAITNPDGGQSIYYPVVSLELWTSSLVGRIDEPNGSVRKRTWEQNTVFCHGSCSGSAYAQNPYVQKETVTIGNSLGDPALTAVTDYTYDKNGNLTSKIEYDWVYYVPTGIETGSEIKRQTSFDYYITTPDAANLVPTNNYGYWQPHYSSKWPDPLSSRRLNAVKRRTVKVGSTNYAATEFVYDYPYSKGNVMQERRWDSVKSSTLPAPGESPTLSTSNSQVLSRSYDTYGNLTDIYEPEVRTHITYNTLGNLVEQVDQGYGTTAQRSMHYDWNSSGTALASKTDIDNNLSTYFTYDNVGRKIAVNESDLRKTETIYDDVNRKVTVKGDLQTFGDGKLQSITHYDQLGRVKFVQKSDGSPLNGDTDGIKAITNYIYFKTITPDAGGRRVVTSTPYRNTDLSDPTLEWSCTEYDRLGRVTKVGMFKGSVAPTDCTSTTNRTGLTTTQYDMESTTVTDPAGKVRKQIRDGLGRLARVIEDPGNSPALNYVTTYTYDPLDNLKYVTQGVQTRTFVYSSLNRLSSATNPESGTVIYAYNDSGDLLSRMDARGKVGAMTYDPLHRILTKTYSDSTPSVNYEYYLAGSLSSPNIGQLKSVSSSEASTSYISYNQLGQITCTRNTISGFAGYPTFNYDWYLNGGIKSVQNPSGRQINYGVDDAGRTIKAEAPNRTYADMTGITNPYTPDGRLAKMQLGNELWETRDYQTPGATTYYKLGTTDGSGDLVQLEYNFSGTNNNGNLSSQVTSRSGGVWQQSFTYDNVNRVSTAMETSGWNRTYGYDQYGNRWVSISNGLAHADPKEPGAQSNFSASTNRLTTTGMQYDASGNQTTYGVFTLGYDAESRNTSATSTGSGSGSFVYDGEGRRVKKVWTPSPGSAVATYFVYNAIGQLAAEYSSEAPASPGTSWMFTDMLGSVRAITSENQTVVECYDYLPFGRMLSASDNQRSSSGCFQTDPDTEINSVIAQKFTSKERDAETGLDFFLARYYSGAQGRFTSPDEPFAAQDPSDPQSWNLYAYVLNNPLALIDETGRGPVAAAVKEVFAHMLENAAARGRNRAWAAERDLAKRGLETSVEWNAAQRAELIASGKVSGYEAHHINNVAAHSLDMAENPNNIEFVKGKAAHFEKHNKNWKNKTTGELIKRLEKLGTAGMMAFFAIFDQKLNEYTGKDACPMCSDPNSLLSFINPFNYVIENQALIEAFLRAGLNDEKTENHSGGQGIGESDSEYGQRRLCGLGAPAACSN